MSRRCVICGKNPNKNDHNYAFNYPKNKKEALVWQQSMGAYDISVDKIQKKCCVCIEHIPEFVQRADNHANILKASFKNKIGEELSKAENASLNVLLLSGATLPPYLGKSSETPSTGDPKQEKTDKDVNIIVQESIYKDLGTTFPDIDETEVTVFRTPLQNDEEITEHQKNNVTSSASKGELLDDDENCTDVLLLGRSQSHITGKCLSKCEYVKPMISPNNYSCEQDVEPQSKNYQSTNGCHCEQLTRYKLREIIKQQQERISELEILVSRQKDWHLSMQHKMASLYSEFGLQRSTQDPQ